MAQLGHIQIFIVGNGIPFWLVEVSQKLEHKKASFIVILVMLHNVTDVGIYLYSETGWHCLQETEEWRV